MIEFVTPCHHQPLEIRHLEEICVEERNGAWWIKDCCCGDSYDTKEDAENALPEFKKRVFNASWKHAQEQLEKQIEEMRRELSYKIREFSDTHDPSLERIYISAIHGKEDWKNVSNHRTVESASLAEALDSVNCKAKYLTSQGYKEVPHSPDNKTLILELKFVKPNSWRFISVWSQPLESSSGGGSSGCEGSYLSCH